MNTFCELIKNKTIAIIKEAQAKTIARLTSFDTYDFDHTVFKTSFVEGVWEPETLLRITDVVFRDEVRSLMIDKDYLPQVNQVICSAREISQIEIELKGVELNPYQEKFKLRHQELYETEILLNQLRRPIDNGDIFRITEGEKAGKYYILVGQECDLMVRSEGAKKGARGARTGSLLPIELCSAGQLFASMRQSYQNQINKEKFGNHYFADKYQLEYFKEGSDSNGIVQFKDGLAVDLNVLDLIVFNELGEAVLNLDNPSYNNSLHNHAWQERYVQIKTGFEELAIRLDTLRESLGEHPDIDAIVAHHNHQLGFVSKLGIQNNYNNRIFNFGIKRVARVRLPKSKNLLDRYYQHLSRFAELHDFAK